MLKPRGELPSGEMVRAWVVQQVLGSEGKQRYWFCQLEATVPLSQTATVGRERQSVGSSSDLTCRLAILFVHFLLRRTNPSIVGSIDKGLLNALWWQLRGLRVQGTLINKSTHGSWKS